MKQTKKLTYNQRKFMEGRGIKDFEGLRFCKENSKEFVYYGCNKNEFITIIK